jgi:hypothetical protein
VAGADTMSVHQAFRRQPVPGQYAQNLALTTIPAPTRGIIQNENDAFIGPGACIVSDNWIPTMRGVKLRGGTIRWCDLHALDAPAWVVAHAYTIGNTAYDAADGTFWNVAVNHTSAATGTFAADRIAHPTYWTANTTITRSPVVSAFEYVSGTQQRMFAGQQTKLFDVTNTTPVLVKSGQTSGNYSAAQLSNQGGYWLIAVNETGDYPLRFNGTSWVTLNGTPPTAWANGFAYVVGNRALDTTDNTYWKVLVNHTSAATGTFSADRIAHPGNWAADTASDGASWITGPPGSAVVNGSNLSYVCKYRNRLFFIQTKSMSVWYLPNTNSIGGQLIEIPMSGAATHGGYLMFMASWSIDAGDGIDDKLVIGTSEGELLIFTGNNPADPNNWTQEGRYQISPPLGINAHDNVGGDLHILTVDGIVPVSQAITKSAGELELALITRAIKPMWRDEVNAKRQFPWTMKKWDEYGGNFITFPGGPPGQRYCLATNNTTGAFARCVGWDAMCFIRLRADFFFGTQDGIIMQADRTGYDDGRPYVATLVGGWEILQSGSANAVWHQARAIFKSPPVEPFEPQLSATTDLIVTIPPPPPPGPDPGLLDVWDEGLWDSAHWDAPAAGKSANRNTMWVSIGMTGFSHAPIVQVTVAQQARPDVELVAIAATYERAGVNV